MTPSEFMGAILPEDGFACAVAFIPGEEFPKSVYKTNRDFDKQVGQWNKIGAEVFFGVSSLAVSGSRKVGNISACQALFLDLDVGRNKPNASKKSALTALKDFCESMELPTPTLVDSGNGVHAYWRLATPLTYNEWLPYAEGLKAACGALGLGADHAITADGARILRLPGSFNCKDPENPKPVRILHMSKPVPTADLHSVLEYTPKEAALAFLDAAPKFSMDPVTEAMLNRRVSNFSAIMKASARKQGCAQLLQAYKSRATLEEPVWRAALSIAQACEDRDTAIHKISRDHPGYSEAVTEKKASATVGPYTCETFDGLVPGICERCPHRGKIKSPIQIGIRVLTLEDAETEIDEDEASLPGADGVAVKPKLQLPPAPWPFFYDKDGGLWIKGEGDKMDELIYPHPFYVVQRMKDELFGEVVLVRVHLPRDGVREFTIPVRDVMTKDKFLNVIAPQGMILLGKKQDALMAFTARSISEMQNMKAADMTRTQFGWNETDTSFVVGDREITAANVKYSPPSSSTINLVPMYGEKGTLEAWRDVMHIYASEEMADRALGLFLGFGNVLLKYTPLRGYILSLYSPRPGTGKTTLLHAVASIYGEPKDSIMLISDTYNARMQRVGTLQNIPALMDEITDMSPKEKGTMAYTITQGRAKNRQQADVNAERLNKTFWHTGMITTSNKSLVSDLMANKQFPGGELSRIMDVHITTPKSQNQSQARQHFAPMYSNYGVAIVPFMQYVTGHLEEVLAFFNKMHARVERDIGARSMDRYWVVMVALAITGGMIAHRLKITTIDPKPVYAAGIRNIQLMRHKFDGAIEDSKDFLGNFLQRHWGNILIINGTVRGPMNAGVVWEPRNTLLARFEPDTRFLYISAQAFRQACSESSIDMDMALAPYKENKSYVGTVRKRLGAGTSLDAPLNTSVLAFDTTKLPELDTKALIEGEVNTGVGGEE